VFARTSLRELAHKPLRTALALTGVAVSTAMLVDMIMLGSGIETSFAELLGSRGYELRVAPKGTLPFDTEALIPSMSSLRDTLETVPGVAGVAPVLAAAVDLRSGGDGSAETPQPRRAFAMGIDPDEQGVYRLIDGAIPSSSEILLDGPTALAMSIAPGDTVGLYAAGGFGVTGRSIRARVSGMAEFFYAAQGDSPIAMRIDDLQALAGRPDQASFAMLRVEEGADPEAVMTAVSASARRVEVVTLSGIVSEASERLSYFRQLSLILGSVSLLVASLLIGTIMAVSVSERLGTIAALRAIGISRNRIVSGLTAESLLLCALGGALGLALGIVVSGYLESILSDFPGLPEAVRFFVLRPRSLGGAYVLLMLVGAAAGFVPAWRATQLEVVSLLHAEEP